MQIFPVLGQMPGENRGPFYRRRGPFFTAPGALFYRRRGPFLLPPGPFYHSRAKYSLEPHPGVGGKETPRDFPRFS